MMHAGYRPVMVPSRHHPCTECTRLSVARFAAEVAGDWKRAERLRTAGWKHCEVAHRG